MIDLNGVRVGFVMTGSFCTFSEAFGAAKALREAITILLHKLMDLMMPGAACSFGTSS